eukprot:jgi/Mesen1/3219/ME001865S02420
MMNLAGFTNILAKTAAHIEKTVQVAYAIVRHVSAWHQCLAPSSIHDVTGPKALTEYDIHEQVGSGGPGWPDSHQALCSPNPVHTRVRNSQVGSGGPGMLWKLYRGTPKSKPQHSSSAEVCVWLLDKKALAEERGRRGTSKAAEEALLEIFRADAARLLRLRHPGVVRVVQALDESKAAMAMVTEPLLCSAANALGCFDNLPKAPKALEDLELGELEVKHGLLQLAETLSFLHNNAKLVHRAISPETVFVTAGGAWKFGGFGFAAFCNEAGVVNAADGDVAFHYPEFDVDSPALPLQPLLNFCAPEVTRGASSSTTAGEVRTNADVFSLGLLAYQLVTKRQLLSCQNNLKTYMAKVSFLSGEPLPGVPPDLLGDLWGMLALDASARPSALAFGGSQYFTDDMRLRALRFLDHMLERDNLQKTEFLKALKGLWTGFDARVLRYKVLPPLLEELRNDAMQHLTLPMVLLIADTQEKEDFEGVTQPALLPVMQTASGETLLLLSRHLPMLISKVSADVLLSHVVTMMVRAFDDADPRIQEEILKQTRGLAARLEYSVLKTAVLPRVHALALKTSIAAVRVHALICLGEFVQRLDKGAVTDVLQTLGRCAAVDHSSPTLMCVLGVADVIQKQLGLEFAAQHVLPLVAPLLVVQQLSAPEFAKYLNFVYAILKKIEEKRGVNLADADGVSLDLNTLSLAGLMEPPPAGRAPKPAAAAPAKAGSTWDDWGGASKKSSSSLPDLAKAGAAGAPPGSVSGPLDFGLSAPSLPFSSSSSPLAGPAGTSVDAVAAGAGTGYLSYSSDPLSFQQSTSAAGGAPAGAGGGAGAGAGAGANSPMGGGGFDGGGPALDFQWPPPGSGSGSGAGSSSSAASPSISFPTPPPAVGTRTPTLKPQAAAPPSLSPLYDFEPAPAYATGGSLAMAGGSGGGGGGGSSSRTGGGHMGFPSPGLQASAYAPLGGPSLAPDTLSPTGSDPFKDWPPASANPSRMLDPPASSGHLSSGLSGYRGSMVTGGGAETSLGMGQAPGGFGQVPGGGRYPGGGGGGALDPGDWGGVSGMPPGTGTSSSSTSAADLDSFFAGTSAAPPVVVSESRGGPGHIRSKGGPMRKAMGAPAGGSGGLAPRLAPPPGAGGGNAYPTQAARPSPPPPSGSPTTSNSTSSLLDL